MDTLSDFRREFVRAIYEQHWQQIRHLQQQRWWLAAVFSVIAGATMIALRGDYFAPDNWPVIVFILVLSLLGLFTSMKIQISIKAHLAGAELILSRYSLGLYLPRYQASPVRRTLRISRMIAKYYLFWFCFFLWTLMYSVSVNAWRSALIAAILYVVSATVVYFWRFDNPSPYEQD